MSSVYIYDEIIQNRKEMKRLKKIVEGMEDCIEKNRLTQKIEHLQEENTNLAKIIVDEGFYEDLTKAEKDFLRNKIGIYVRGQYQIKPK